MLLADEYPDGLCPDCDLSVPVGAIDGQDCDVGGQAFGLPASCTNAPCEECLNLKRLACLPEIGEAAPPAREGGVVATQARGSR
jgi:hypothetical protein